MLLRRPNLIYANERAQYAEVRKQYWTGPKVIVGQEKEMSLIYGTEHLLRMLGMFSFLLRLLYFVLVGVTIRLTYFM